MELIRWKPANNMFSLRSPFNSLLDDFFLPRWQAAAENTIWNWNPVVDIFDQGDAFVVQAELPGVDKKDITVDVKDRTLTISGQREATSDVKEDNYYRKERSYGRFERVFTLPAAVSADHIKAEYKDGVLKIAIPKPEQYKPKQISIH